MRFFLSVKECTRLNRVINDIKQDLDVLLIIEMTSWYKERWRDYVMHMSLDRITRQTMSYKPMEK